MPFLSADSVAVRGRYSLRAAWGLALSFLLFLTLATSARAQMSLQEAVLLATKNDPGIEALRQEVAIKTVDIDAARDAYFPAISLSGETSTTDSDGPGVVLSCEGATFSDDQPAGAGACGSQRR